jgi:WD40 repeat protein
LASTSTDKTVRIWDLTRPEPTAVVLNQHTGSVWLPDLVDFGGKAWLVTPSFDGTARLWNFPGGDPCTFSSHSPEDREVLRHGAPVRRAVMDSKARWIVTAGSDGRAIVWDRKTGAQLAVVVHGKPVRDVAFKPDSSLFVTASADNTAQVWDAQTGKGVATLAGHTDCVFSARFTNFGPGVVTVSWDQTARLWNYETKKCVAVLKGHLDVLWSVAQAPTGTSFTTASGDATARIWPLRRIPGGDAFLPPPAQQTQMVK